MEMLGQTLTAFDMKLQGCRNEDIANALGLSVETVRTRIYDELAVITEEVETSREMFRALEVARLEMLQTGLWTKATNGDLDAIDRVLKIMDRRSKLLGLDQPTRIDIIDWRSEAERVGINPEDLFEWVIDKFSAVMEGRATHLLADLQKDEPDLGVFFEVEGHEVEGYVAEDATD
jgi:hypothetical protein